MRCSGARGVAADDTKIAADEQRIAEFEGTAAEGGVRANRRRRAGENSPEQSAALTRMGEGSGPRREQLVRPFGHEVAASKA